MGTNIFHDTPDKRTIPQKIAMKTKDVPKSLCKANNAKTGIVKSVKYPINLKSFFMDCSSWYLWNVTITLDNMMMYEIFTNSEGWNSVVSPIVTQFLAPVEATKSGL